MKKFTKVIALILSLTLLLCFPIGVSAAEPEDTGVDTAAKGSLTIYKVDLTSAEKDGAWDSSYVSTGVYDQNVNSHWEKQYWLGVRLGLAAMVFLTLVAGAVLYIRRNRERTVHRKGGRYVRK